MVEIIGLTGLRPTQATIGALTTPPYDVIKPGSPLESRLRANPSSLYHVTLGTDPATSLGRLIDQGILQSDDEPCFYVYEQQYGDEARTGVLVAARVSDYSRGEIRRHERTFDDKVKGRLELTKTTGYFLEPVFVLTQAAIGPVLEEAKAHSELIYRFVSDFGVASGLHGTSGLNGIGNRIFRLKAAGDTGLLLKELIGKGPLYIADGHHRYHAALLGGQTHFLAYITDNARIQAYNRVINGPIKFHSIMDELNLRVAPEFKTPAKHQFALYSNGRSYLLDAVHVPEDVVGRLDCSILERELYPKLGLTQAMTADGRYFDYYPESELDRMKERVDSGEYDVAVALHPISIAELMAVADAGLHNPGLVMPEKSTFFAPKILSGIFIQKV
jgi:uncharacterized protein (DUF1015 family)